MPKARRRHSITPQGKRAFPGTERDLERMLSLEQKFQASTLEPAEEVELKRLRSKLRGKV